jgi:hypothetical protein
MASRRTASLVLGLIGALALDAAGPVAGHASAEDGLSEAWPETAAIFGEAPRPAESSFRTCAETASGVFAYILQVATGAPLDEARRAAPSAGSAAALQALIEAEGVEAAYLSSHEFYLRCAAEVETRIGPARPTGEEAAYAECGFRSANRLMTLTAVRERRSKAELLAQVPDEAREPATILYDIAERDSLLKALVISGEAHRACVGGIEQRSAGPRVP